MSRQQNNQPSDFLELKHRNPDYANWIPIKLVSGCTGVGIASALAAILLRSFSILSSLLLSLLALAIFLFTFYMLRARSALSYQGGGVQGKVLDSVLSFLDKSGFSGHGKLLDIGCGSGAMSVKAAKKYPHALITGIDYWGKGWEYSQQLCEHNAALEGASGRITFRKGDAARLDFLDGTFDAAVSNFVFHEVRSQKDKHALLLEALRVIKPGGYFAFQDIFYAKSHYGNIENFINALKPYVSEIHFVDTRKPEYAPKFLNTPLVLGQMGLIYGRR